MDEEDDAGLAAWARSGAMALTGRSGGPALGPPAALTGWVGSLGRDLREQALALGSDLAVDPLPLLAERAAVMGWSRHGSVSCGGATRLLPCGDGWIAVCLARPEDADAVAAWLEHPMAPSMPVDERWAAVAAVVATRPAGPVIDRARLLGIPAALLPPVGAPVAPAVSATSYDGPSPGRVREPGELVVVDLSSLWAGPLCTHLLQQVGLRVIKVESSPRPDGARSGPPAFFDLLHGGKESVALDLADGRDVAALRRLLLAADVVVEASRPRALEQLGIRAAEFLARGPSVWVSLTGYGRAPGCRDAVAFGDDAAVAGGLVVGDGAGPCFCADAVADPLAGLQAAAAALSALADGRRVLLDVAMAGVAASCAGPTLPVPPHLVAAPPRARQPGVVAAPLGADTRRVLGALSP